MILNLEKILYICHLLADCGPGHYKGKIDPTVIFPEEMMPAYSAQAKPLRRSQETPVVSAMLTVEEPAKWLMLNTQHVVSYMGDLGSCPEDCGGGNKVANAGHTACGKLHG